MKKIEWAEELSLNDKEIDCQHRQIIDLLNKLIDRCENNTLGDIKTLDEMSYFNKYIEEHFKSEENLAEKHGYPKAESLKRSHELIRKNYMLLRESLIFYMENDKYFVRGFLNKLIPAIIELFQAHLKYDDRELIEFVNKC